MPKKFRLFLDTSVVISGLNSPFGASAKILSLAREDKVSVIISSYILGETRRVIQEKLPKLELPFTELEKEKLLFCVKELLPLQTIKASKLIQDKKDAPILASAMQEKVDYLITLDRKDFIDDPQVAKRAKLKILTPGVFVKLFRKF